MVVVVEEEVVVIEALEGAAGLPAVTFSRLHLEWNNCPLPTAHCIIIIT